MLSDLACKYLFWLGIDWYCRFDVSYDNMKRRRMSGM